MHTRVRIIACLWLALSASAPARAEAPPIRLNTIGFLPDQPKQATLSAAGTNFSILRSGAGGVACTGTISGPRLNADTQEPLFLADFTALKEAGEFQLDVPGAGRSAPFRIGPDVYHEAFRTVTRAMYLWRCGTAVSGTHHGQTFAHAPCHTNDAWLDFGGGGQIRSNALGGWHDAGDSNKYVVNAGVTVGLMFRAGADFGPAIRRIKLDLPECDGAVPEFLAALKWELDWLLTMQAPDGSVYHKISTRAFGAFLRPENETTARYFTPWSSTGDYQKRDLDDRLWAAAELWETTGNPGCLPDFEKRATAFPTKVDSRLDWGNLRNLGRLTYLFSARAGKNAALTETIRASLLNAADEIVAARAAHGYARPLGTFYNWGGNGGVAGQVLMLQAACRISPQAKYRHTALDAVGYLFGRNPFARSFVTGLGHNPPQHPHDRRSGADKIAAPWPGYLVGGPNPRATDWHDEEKDYRTNEIAINWNGALIYALAALLDEADR